MNEAPDLDRVLRRHFEARADGTVLDVQLDAVLTRAATMGQRPAWLAARSHPMTAITLRSASAVPRAVLVLAALGLLLVLAFAALSVGQRPGPPINGRIVFGRFDPALGDTVVYTVNPDGTHLEKVRPEPHEGPFWSPDGTHLGLGDGVANADGSNHVVWDQSGNPFHVECWDWSPDGARMLCEGFADDPSADRTIHGVYTVRASDGRDLFRLSRPGDEGIPGAYSPDGSTVAYTGTAPDGTRGALLLVNVDGTHLHRLGQLVSDNTRTGGVSDLTWAPDGRSVLASINGRLFQIDLATGAAKTINIAGDPNASLEGGVWSPDGTRILIKKYISGGDPDPNVDLFTIRPDGSDLVRVTNDPDDDRFVDWGTHPVE